MTDAPAGRAREWEVLRGVLDSGRSAVVLITGPPGSGRTYLMQRFGELAKRHHFWTAGFDPDGAFAVERTTRLGDVDRALTALLVGEEAATASAIARGTENLDLWTVRPEARMLSLIERRAPVAIAVDGYDPNPSLGAWVDAELLPRIRESVGPVVLAFADRLDRLSEIIRPADTVLELAALDVDEIAEHFLAMTDGARNRLTESEAWAYATAASVDPALMKSFDAVLRAAADWR